MWIAAGENFVQQRVGTSENTAHPTTHANLSSNDRNPRSRLLYQALPGFTPRSKALGAPAACANTASHKS
jgi:hypothetical protein